MGFFQNGSKKGLPDECTAWREDCLTGENGAERKVSKQLRGLLIRINLGITGKPDNTRKAAKPFVVRTADNEAE